jgi:hypothetical protein
MKLYVSQRLRIAGSNGEQLFDPEALAAIYRYSNGIPRVVNLICEQCLVSAFVDQQRVVMAHVVDAVAREFDLADGSSLPMVARPAPSVPPAPAARSSKVDLDEALKTLTDLADRLRGSEPGSLKKRKL